jgi:hypothetical protein
LFFTGVPHDSVEQSVVDVLVVLLQLESDQGGPYDTLEGVPLGSDGLLLFGGNLGVVVVAMHPKVVDQKVLVSHVEFSSLSLSGLEVLVTH